MDELCREIDGARDILVLVEGPNDKRSLERLGFQKIIFMNKALYKIVEAHQNEEEIIILTDLDQHGKGLHRFFYHEFTRRGVRVNNRLRMLLMQTPVKHIEGLAHYIERRELRSLI
jgi:5S rRNA maturation endonuclease (ribonuclease M5)